MYTNRFVISLGGSLVITGEAIDTEYLKEFAAVMHKQVALHPDRQFFIVVGGGETARKYQQAARDIDHHVTNKDLDWMGIYATHINAQLIRVLLGDIVHEEVIHQDQDLLSLEEPVVIVSGWQPKSSSDGGVVTLAAVVHADHVLNLSNIDYVYDKNPKEFPHARPFTQMTWDQLLAIVGDTWVPGMHAPFDPNAIRRAKEAGLTVIMANGKNLENVENIFESQAYIGTTVS